MIMMHVFSLDMDNLKINVSLQSSADVQLHALLNATKMIQ